MKIGLRHPSLMKMLRARTTGKFIRKVKKVFIPFYVQKGMGLIRDPKRSIYNRVYKRTTFGISDIFKK